MTYSILHGQTLASEPIQCPDCDRHTCECVLIAMHRARRLVRPGYSVRVVNAQRQTLAVFQSNNHQDDSNDQQPH